MRALREDWAGRMTFPEFLSAEPRPPMATGARATILAIEMASDTEPLATAAQVAAARRLGAAERLRSAAEMSEEARRISIDGERRRHPELSEAEARARVLRRMWGADLAARVPETAPRRR